MVHVIRSRQRRASDHINGGALVRRLHALTTQSSAKRSIGVRGAHMTIAIAQCVSAGGRDVLRVGSLVALQAEAWVRTPDRWLAVG
jgi:hypothetical protein